MVPVGARGLLLEHVRPRGRVDGTQLGVDHLLHHPTVLETRRAVVGVEDEHPAIRLEVDAAVDLREVRDAGLVPDSALADPADGSQR